MLMDDHMFTPEEIAEKLHFSRSYVYALLKSGRLPSVRVGRVYRITQGGLNQFIFKYWFDDEPPIDLDHFNG